MSNTQDTIVMPAQEAADAVAYGYPLGANVRDELALWLRKRGEVDPYAQRIVRLLMLQNEE